MTVKRSKKHAGQSCRRARTVHGVTGPVAIAAGLVILVFAVLLSLTAPTGDMSFGDALSALLRAGSRQNMLILYRIRIPRMIAALACGMGLSLSGMLLQYSLNNSLASPGMLGINSGAGLFVLVSALLFPYQPVIRTLFGFCGAMLATMIVYEISAKTGVSKSSLLLAGVAVSSMMSAFMDIIITFWPETVADKAAFNLGGFGMISASQVWIGTPIVVVATVLAFLCAGGLDLIQLGDETAHGLGLNVKRFRLLIIIAASLLAAASVCMCGLLSFLGLIVPNFVRMFVKGNARMHVAMTAILGAGFLLLCDTLGRTLFYPYELPVGLFLSCLGAAFFIRMLIGKRKSLEL